MMFVAHGNGNPRIAAVEAYLLALREDVQAAALSWLITIAAALGPILRFVSGIVGKRPTAAVSAEVLVHAAGLSELISILATRVSNGELDEPEAIASMVAGLADTLDELGNDLELGDDHKTTLKRVAAALLEGMDLATSIAAAVHDDDDDDDEDGDEVVD